MQTITHHDEGTLIELKEKLGWESSPENTTAVAMILCERLEKLTNKVDQLEAQLSQAVKEDEHTRRECSYYKHYNLWYNPEVNGPKLEHEAYHEAEKMCGQAQKRISDWMDQNPDTDPIAHPTGKALWDAATRWEHRIAA